MSNSQLVDYTCISPNRSSPRTHAIDTVTIHCVVGQCTVETLGGIFAAPSRQASSNYGVGKDGKIGLYVEEKDRSWCSGGYDANGNPIRVNGISGADNDQRAITIEVASDTTDPYTITDEAYEGLIRLLVDICKRNPGIGRLRWQGDKSLVGQTDRQNMTVHRWFARKACPGDYLYDRHTAIAAEVNRRLDREEGKEDNTVKEWWEEPLAWAKENGIIYGDANGNLKLDEPCTRRQMITFLYRLYKLLVKKLGG